MKALIVHYKNKYPGALVKASDDSIDVWCRDGHHRVAMRKNGAGQMVDVSAEYGCIDCHDLSPIPKNSRVHKLHKDGKIGFDELAEERMEASQKLAKDGKILSIKEYEKEKASFDVDDKGHVTLKPVKA